ncbi:MAG: glycosyltransferase family 4 protein, partial [Anaerolineae bacterium]|nr:glycosyltransferase family 4 protein [Anaerolineae bacterium]
YIGRLSQEKGVQTAIMALSYLTHQKKYQNLQLLIAGAGEPEYETELRELVQQEQLEPNVKFLGLQPKDAIPELYQQADIFLFTSIWPEPFGRVIVEAMASGVAVIGAPVGGAAEIMIEKENALQFIPGDAENLASQIEELLKSPSLCHQISEAGKKTARAKFDLQRMVDEIEVYLQSLIVRK